MLRIERNHAIGCSRPSAPDRSKRHATTQRGSSFVASVLRFGVIALAACSHGGSYTVAVRSARSLPNAAGVELYVVPACGTAEALGAAPDEFTSRMVFSVASTSPPLGDVEPGSIALYARVRDAQCSVIAAGCATVMVTAGGSGELVVPVQPIAGALGCDVGRACATGLCVTPNSGDGGLDGIDVLTPDSPLDIVSNDAPLPTDVSGDDGACMNATCVAIPPPQLLSPRSTAIVATRTPTFRWQLASGSDGAAIDICATPDCAVPEATVTGTTQGTCATPLAPGAHFARPFGTLGGVRGAMAGPTWRFHVWNTNTGAAASFGHVLDLDRDGFADLAITAASPARVEIDRGSASGLVASGQTLTSTTAGFGTSMAPAGDVNGDGYADLVVAANGAVFVYPGSATGVMDSPTTLQASTRGTVVGARAAGDVNDDGFGDLVGATSGVGATLLVWFGSASGPVDAPVTISPPATSTLFAHSYDAVGDVNGDGFDDVAVGAFNAVYIYEGSSSGLGDVPATTIPAPSGATQFGGALAGIGDVSGDGNADLAVASCSFGTGNTSSVYVFLGTGAGIATSGPAFPITTSSGCPEPLGVGDLNGDGIGDLVVRDSVERLVLVYAGSFGGPTSFAASMLSGTNDYAAAAVIAGDVDGNGIADLAVSTPALNSVGIYLGAIGPFPSTPSATLTPSSSSSTYGSALAFARRHVEASRCGPKVLRASGE